MDFSRKRKRSRWNDETPDQKTIIPGMSTVIPPGLSREQERAYIVQLQIEDLTRKLRMGDLGIPPNPEDRSPSPEPIYNSEGKRLSLNTREFRTRKKLEEERHNLITEMVGLNPDFKPPVDYKPPATRVSDKVMIPQDEYPEINFVGLLIGPRGNTLKNIEKECNAKIMIRGKGSVKEGKVGRKDGQMLPGEDDLTVFLFVLESHNRHKTKARMDKEYLSLMAELGEAPVPSSMGPTSSQSHTPIHGAPRPTTLTASQPLMNRPPWMGSDRPFQSIHGGPHVLHFLGSRVQQTLPLAQPLFRHGSSKELAHHLTCRHQAP
uniref:Branchpoint-bridging protein n=1 Tax=Leptobrachium leishanense TaxID=445787 RepID=A0A8C5WL14_9ANUR